MLQTKVAAVKRVYPYYIGSHSNSPSTWSVVFNNNCIRFWTTANYSDPANEILLDGSLNLNPYKYIRITANRTTTVETRASDEIIMYFITSDKKTRTHVSSPVQWFRSDGPVVWTSSDISSLSRDNVFIHIGLITDWPEDPNGGNHFWDISKIELLTS